MTSDIPMLRFFSETPYVDEETLLWLKPHMSELSGVVIAKPA